MVKPRQLSVKSHGAGVKPQRRAQAADHSDVPFGQRFARTIRDAVLPRGLGPTDIVWIDLGGSLKSVKVGRRRLVVVESCEHCALVTRRLVTSRMAWKALIPLGGTHYLGFCQTPTHSQLGARA